MRRTRGLFIGALLGAPLYVPPCIAPAHAQIPAFTSGPVTGRDFAGVQFPQQPVAGTIHLAGTRITHWSEGTCRRLLITGTVRVRLAQYSFEASRASVWMERVGEQDGKAIQQVFIYFDEVGTAAAASGAVSIAAPRLPVRAMILLEAPIGLAADLVSEGRPEPRGRLAVDAQFLLEAEDVLARVINRQLNPDSPPLTGLTARRDGLPTPAELTRRLEGSPPPPIFARQGIISIAPGNITLVSGEQENALMASDGVTVAYFDQASRRTLQLSAQRAVIFLDPGPIAELSRFSVDQVRGIYLEGDVVATDGKYTIRGPQIYYDLRANKAVLLDAVFWTYDERRRVPLYVRAETIRQESSQQFTATKAVFTNTAFFDPEFSIGASSVTITREEKTIPKTADAPATTQTTTTALARDITLRAGGVPFFWWPYYRGDPELFPLKDFRVENRTGVGGSIKTRWNAHALLGRKPPEGFSSELIADLYFERGPALGTDTRWESENSKGRAFVYGFIPDRGDDRLPTGATVSRDTQVRGILTAEQRWRMSESWSLLGEGAYISDESFVPAFFESMGKNRREFATRLAAQRTSENTVFVAQAKASLNDFVANEYLLQSQGYSVAKLPEVSYIRLADDVLYESFPGSLTYFSEYRAGRLELQFDENSAASRGMNSLARAQRAFGITPTQSPGDALRASGLTEDAVHRLDTRHELAAKIPWGPAIVTPFVVGRVTAYDDDFATYNAGQGDDIRLWSAAGVRISTTISRVYEDVESRILDLHRLRHVLEPNASIWIAGTSVESRLLPVYDESVEALADGAVAKIGLTQILQTQRGGAGRWHTTDVLTLDTHVVVSSGDADSRGPIGRYYDYRPEYSNPGEYLVADATWRVTDAFALTGSSVFDFDKNQQAMASTGFLIYHAPGFVSGIDARYINSQDSTIISAGAQYDLTSKYAIALAGSYDATRGGVQGGGVEVRRRFASLMLGINVGYNDISGESSLGFVIVPFGAVGEARISGIGASSTNLDSD